MASLVVSEGPAAGKHFALARHRLVMIGRDEHATFQVLDEHISRRHLQVRYVEADGCHLAIDVGSANGVAINGRRMEPAEEMALVDGDRISIGRTVIVYTTQDFDDAESAMRGIRSLGEFRRSTLLDD